MLGRGLKILPFIVIFAYVVRGQQPSIFKVKDGQDFHSVALSLQSANGHSIIRSHDQEDFVAIYRYSESEFQPAITEEIVNGTKRITLAVDDRLIDCFDEMLFSPAVTAPEQSYRWKVLLSKHKPVDLDIHYALGDAFLDLSDLDVRNLKIRSGHANVLVDHLRPGNGLVRMDSLYIDVDWGSIQVQNIHRTRARNIQADIGFGNMGFDLSNAPHFEGLVEVSVGAGKLEVHLPRDRFPVKVVVKDSPLCRMRFAKEFEKVGEDTFVLEGNMLSSVEPLVFNVNVGMGSVFFRTVD